MLAAAGKIPGSQSRCASSGSIACPKFLELAKLTTQRNEQPAVIHGRQIDSATWCAEAILSISQVRVKMASVYTAGRLRR